MSSLPHYLHNISSLTFSDAMHPSSATILHSMWYALSSRVSECVTWLAIISTMKKAVVKNSTTYSWTGWSRLNHSLTAMALLNCCFTQFSSSLAIYRYNTRLSRLGTLVRTTEYKIALCHKRWPVLYGALVGPEMKKNVIKNKNI